MSAKHTPGPWKINADCPMAEHGQISIETDGYYIALLDAGARQTANARLIAAAPDLLDALQDYDDAFTGFDPSSKESRHRMRLAVIKARAAIAKAGGAA